MNLYVTGNTIRQLREQKKMTQAELADKIDVSSKTISKWETAKGLPDISLLKPLSAALGVSVMELMKGDAVINQNRSANLLRSKLYVCPICGNVIHTEPVEDEHFITVHHPMTKSHYISFLAYVTSEKFQMIKLYPEGNAECRFRLRGRGYLYCYCNRHGLMVKQIR